MDKIGNIVFEGELVNHSKVDYVNYIDFNKISKYDDSLPTLFVGWNFFKKTFNDFVRNNNISILNKEIIPLKYYWEFSFDEKKEEHVSGVEIYTINVPYFYFRYNYKYKNIDPIFNNIESLDDLFRKFHLKILNGVYNYKNEMLYVLSSNKIYGIDLKIFSYLDIPINDIIENFKQKTNSYFEDLDGSKHTEYYKIYPRFEELKRYLVVLLSKA